MRRKMYAVLCALTLLFLLGCDTDNSASVASPQDEPVNRSDTIAIKYMQDKYGLDCTVIKVHGVITGFLGDTFDQVLMRAVDDPEGEALKEKEGQRCLDHVNFADQFGSTFAVYVEPDERTVIGDQYMLYAVYPLLDEWINEQTSKYAPCQPCCRYLELCTNDLQKYDYCCQYACIFPRVLQHRCSTTRLEYIYFAYENPISVQRF